jgi:hypothetical protein
LVFTATTVNNMIRHQNRLPEPMTASSTKAGWRPNEWTRDTGLSRASLYRLLKDGKIKAVKSGSATIIITSPAEYLAGLGSEAA